MAQSVSPKPFDRKAHCQRIGASGGQTTYARHGHFHMATIGRAGAQATIKTHGAGYLQGILAGKGWTGRRAPSLARDLAAGRALAF